MNKTVNLPTSVFNQNIYKIVLSKPQVVSDTNHLDSDKKYIRAEIVSNGEKFQASLFTEKQVFHENLDASQVKNFVENMLSKTFMQYTAWDGKREYLARITKKSKLLTSSKILDNQPSKKTFVGSGFNKQKNYIINEGENIPALVDMGVFTKEYKICSQMHGKFQQINRFIELIADEVKPPLVKEGTQINIIDFGCGKSYLTFLVYHYFTKIRNLPVSICGLDLDKKVIDTCTKAAEKYGYANIVFKQGDIGKQTTPPLQNWGNPGTFNIMISLHACDTATDYAIFNAIKWEADLICAVPCCQHELKAQIKPKNLDIFSDYGIIKERMASLATDAIRAKLLEHMGYKTQIIEFTSMEHTPKNLFIRARRSNKNPKAMESVSKLLEEFSFKPTLLGLLTDFIPEA